MGIIEAGNIVDENFVGRTTPQSIVSEDLITPTEEEEGGVDGGVFSGLLGDGENFNLANVLECNIPLDPSWNNICYTLPYKMDLPSMLFAFMYPEAILTTSDINAIWPDGFEGANLPTYGNAFAGDSEQIAAILEEWGPEGQPTYWHYHSSNYIISGHSDPNFNGKTINQLNWESGITLWKDSRGLFYWPRYNSNTISGAVPGAAYTVYGPGSPDNFGVGETGNGVVDGELSNQYIMTEEIYNQAVSKWESDSTNTWATLGINTFISPPITSYNDYIELQDTIDGHTIAGAPATAEGAKWTLVGYNRQRTGDTTEIIQATINLNPGLFIGSGCFIIKNVGGKWAWLTFEGDTVTGIQISGLVFEPGQSYLFAVGGPNQNGIAFPDYPNFKWPADSPLDDDTLINEISEPDFI